MRGNKMVTIKLVICSVHFSTLNVEILDIGSNNSRPEQQNQTQIF